MYAKKESVCYGLNPQQTLLLFHLSISPLFLMFYINNELLKDNYLSVNN